MMVVVSSSPARSVVSSLALLVALLTIGSTSLSAQGNVGLSAGVRVGFPAALSAKLFVSDEIAVEGMVGIRPYFGQGYSSTQVRVAGFYHIPLDLDNDLQPLQAYVGAGAGLNFWNYSDQYYLDIGRERGSYSRLGLGLRGYVGLQYAFTDKPLELTFDVGPGLRFGSGFYGLFNGHTSLGLRYIISRR